MRIPVLAAVLAAAVGAVAAPALADPVEGVWQTAPQENGQFGHVRIEPCGSHICGTLVRAFGADGRQIESQNIGRRIVWDMQPQGNGRYGRGRIWSPVNDRTYRSKMQLQGDVLSVSGCVAGGLLCQDNTWRRVE